MKHAWENDWFLATLTVYISSSPFLNVTQCRFIVIYRRFGTAYRYLLQVSYSLLGLTSSSISLLDSWKLDRHVVPKRRQLTANQPCITSQKSEDIRLRILLTSFFQHSKKSFRCLTNEVINFLTLFWGANIYINIFFCDCSRSVLHCGINLLVSRIVILKRKK
jgi:hypothetical protein